MRSGGLGERSVLGLGHSGAETEATRESASGDYAPDAGSLGLGGLAMG